MQKLKGTLKYPLIGLFVAVISIAIIKIFFFDSVNDKIFEIVPSSRSHVNFINDLSYNNTFNSYTYNNFYSGGGVALGDINNDGLLDVYLVANQKKNRLYLNKGNFTFEDITDQSGAGGIKPWSTGVSMADINGDGFLDIYVSNAGLYEGNQRKNELFINNGDLTFTEKAETFQIADSGLSIHATFFDYDKDGDLDLYLLNYSPRPINSFNQNQNLRTVRDYMGGDRLYRNNLRSNSKDSSGVKSSGGNNGGLNFTDVTDQAGIFSSAIGFGLGATVGDVNRDGWMDIYISNDFFERDYLYINNRNGTFRESLELQMNSISTTSMSGDISDLNNDGYPEIFIADMLPEKEQRIKTLTDFIGWDQYQAEINNGYYRKFLRNTLQYNNGNGTFSEIGRYAGVEATDWSWGALITDFNLDGLRDIFVPNGVYKDMTNKDILIDFTRNKRSYTQNGEINYGKLINSTPSNPLANYIFENQGELRFINQAVEWGLDDPSFSNGAAYGDLDDDGDLDLVVNNVNMKSFVYKNQSSDLHPDRAWIKIDLKGQSPNTYGVGAQVELEADGQYWFSEQILQRGFQSSVDPTMLIGLGKDISLIDRIKVTWSNGSVNILKDVKTRQKIIIDESRADNNISAKSEADISTSINSIHNRDPFLTDITNELNLNWKHQESSYNDFKSSPMLFHMNSTEGPPLCIGDINNDGLEDFYVGGAAQQTGELFIQKKLIGFEKIDQPVLEADRNSEDTDCLFFDADGDGNHELYVASGSNEYSVGNKSYADRLYDFYENERLEPIKDALPEPKGGYQPTGVVRSSDIDGDGDLDLFVGVRMNSSNYGLPVGGYLLINSGTGRFKDETNRIAPNLQKDKIQSAGITTAQFGDLNGDSTPDLVIAGEWMPLTIFFNNNGYLEQADLQVTGLEHTEGWWHSLNLADLDGNGTLEIIGGNHGLNSRFKASQDKPIEMWVGDFDNNGIIEQIYTRYSKEGGPYPVSLYQNLVLQLPYLRSLFPTFEKYSNSTINELFEQQQLDSANHYKVGQLESIVGWNNGEGHFKINPLPFSAQLSPMYSILVEDLDQNGKPEIIMGGNMSSAQPQAGPYTASFGTILRQDSTRKFIEIHPLVSGFFHRGEIRAIRKLQFDDRKIILVTNNNESIKIYEVGH